MTLISALTLWLRAEIKVVVSIFDCSNLRVFLIIVWQSRCRRVYMPHENVFDEGCEKFNCNIPFDILRAVVSKLDFVTIYGYSLLYSLL